MSTVTSSTFGRVEYQTPELFHFPGGLPGFPDENEFLPVEIPDQLPLLYLQSLRTPDLCFVTLPVQCLITGYELKATPDDLARIGMKPDTRPGTDMLCLALVCFGEDGGAVANLRAPILVNVEDRLAVQAIQTEERYPIRYSLDPERTTASC